MAFLALTAKRYNQESLLVKNDREDLQLLSKLTDEGVIMPYISESFRLDEMVKST